MASADLTTTRARKSALAKLPDKPDQILWHDGYPRGFGLRVRPGRSSWIFQYRLAGERRVRRLTLGEFDSGATSLPPAVAFKLAMQAKLAADAGEDPRPEPPPEADPGVTFGQAAEAYRQRAIPRLAVASQRVYDSWLRGLEEYWDDRPIDTITPSDVARFMDAVAIHISGSSIPDPNLFTRLS